eukprot:4271948-Amphidinium_carterae.1
MAALQFLAELGKLMWFGGCEFVVMSVVAVQTSLAAKHAVHWTTRDSVFPTPEPNKGPIGIER